MVPITPDEVVRRKKNPRGSPPKDVAEPVKRENKNYKLITMSHRHHPDCRKLFKHQHRLRVCVNTRGKWFGEKLTMFGTKYHITTGHCCGKAATRFVQQERRAVGDRL